MKNFLILILCLIAMGQGRSGVAAENPKELLEQSDRARGGTAKGISWKVKLESNEDGNETSTTYELQVKGNNTLALVVEPPRSKGETMIFNDRTIWLYKPAIKKPVAISARQKLSGQAANGDIASTNYARDYTGKIVGEETVDGKPCHVLMLTSNDKNTTYDGIKYWISKDKKLGLKAEFLTLKGKPLKVANFKYGNTLNVDGEKLFFVSEVKIVDAKNDKNFSVMTYTAPKVSPVSDSIFNVNNLTR